MKNLTQIMLKVLFRKEEENLFMLSDEGKKGAMMAVIQMQKIWTKESFYNKVKSVLTFNWTPSKEILYPAIKKTFMDDVFGQVDDYGEELFKLSVWHHAQDWDLTSLTDFDKSRSEGLNSMSIMVRMSHREGTSDLLNLNLAERAPQMCFLAYPMVVKIPIISLQYFIDIDSAFAFNQIRKSGHPQADNIISYLYDLILIQQKIANSLHEYIRLADYNQKNKENALFIRAELDCIRNADLVFSYLKATIEKTIVILGLTHEILNLDAKKTHKSKLDAIERAMPDGVKQQGYYEFIWESIQSETIADLNNYRSGLLHKKGISDLQPHNYVGETPESIPLLKIFSVLNEQHARNTAVIVGVLAILTDKLVQLDPPSITPEELFDSIEEKTKNY
jgi:hypothetical protein